MLKLGKKCSRQNRQLCPIATRRYRFINTGVVISQKKCDESSTVKKSLSSRQNLFDIMLQ